MKRYITSGAAVALAFVIAGCDSFLTGPGLTESPNNAVGGTAQQQLIALQANMWARLEGQIARNATIYTQQIIGSNNQQLTYATQYSITEGDIQQNFTGFYTGGGLVAMRNIQKYGADNDKLLEGIAKIWEGLAFGMATSVWGDLPYSEAVSTVDIPKLDSQQDIYTAVQARLDEGIAALQAAPTAGSCEPTDLVYCAVTTGTRAQQIARWIAAAHTLKARFYLHLVERNGNAAYTQALAEAAQGINEAPANATQAMHGQAPGDFRSFHGSTLDVDGNIWAEFLTARGGDIGAGNTLVSLLKSRNDPRLSQYFTSNNASGEFWGLSQNNQIVGAPAGEVASVVNIPVRRALNFRQPIVTWAENQLIQAEAQFVLNGGAAALPFINAVRTSVGMSSLGAVATLNEVMEEKYVAQFQNIDVWNDYKRTCYPAVARYQNAAEVPGRLPYGSAERNANPNIPLPSAYPAGTTGVSALRNWNDPIACP